MRAGCLALALLGGLAAGAAGAGPALPPTPFQVVHVSRRTPPFLDAVPACIPRQLEGGLELSVRLRDRDILGARRALAKQTARVERGDADSSALRALFAARTAAAADRERARGALRRVAERDERPAVRRCAWLERARLSLLLERPFDARVDRSRAQRSGEHPAEGEGATLALWLAAEEAHREGDAASARKAWSEIASGADARLAIAAKLRLLEARFPIGGAATDDAEDGWRELERLLASASSARLDVEPWSLVAGELAIRAGDLEAAHHWLARAELNWRGGLAGIRKADVLAALGRTPDARAAFERIARGAPEEPARHLAALRLGQLDLEAGKPALAERRARAALGSVHPVVRGEALLLLAAAQLAGHRTGAALETTLQAARAGAPPERAEQLATALGAVLADSIAPEASCASVLQRLGSRSELLLRSTRDASALLRVGDCFLELQLPVAALHTYRVAARRYAQDPAAALAVRIATAALAAGDLDTVRRALENAPAESADRGDDDVELLRWRWLRYALAKREGRSSDALPQLASLARAAALPADLRPEVERALLERLDRADEAPAAREALGASIASAPELASEARGTSWLRLADAALASSEIDSARSAYARAAELLSAGPQRDRARHHLALLAGSKQQRRDALAAAAGEEPRSPWSRVAALELRLQRLAEQVDGEQAVRP